MKFILTLIVLLMFAIPTIAAELPTDTGSEAEINLTAEIFVDCVITEAAALVNDCQLEPKSIVTDAFWICTDEAYALGLSLEASGMSAENINLTFSEFYVFMIDLTEEVQNKRCGKKILNL